MCSILYQPCDEQSFRIGPGAESVTLNMVNDQFQDNNGLQGVVVNENEGIMNGANGGLQMNPIQMQVLADDSGNSQPGNVTTTVTTTTTTTMLPISSSTQQTMPTTPVSTTTLSSSSVAESTSRFNLKHFYEIKNS